MSLLHLIFSCLRQTLRLSFVVCLLAGALDLSFDIPEGMAGNDEATLSQVDSKNLASACVTPLSQTARSIRIRRNIRNALFNPFLAYFDKPSSLSTFHILSTETEPLKLFSLNGLPVSHRGPPSA